MDGTYCFFGAPWVKRGSVFPRAIVPTDHLDELLCSQSVCTTHSFRVSLKQIVCHQWFYQNNVQCMCIYTYMSVYFICFCLHTFKHRQLPPPNQTTVHILHEPIAVHICIFKHIHCICIYMYNIWTYLHTANFRYLAQKCFAGGCIYIYICPFLATDWGTIRNFPKIHECSSLSAKLWPGGTAHLCMFWYIYIYVYICACYADATVYAYRKG